MVLNTNRRLTPTVVVRRRGAWWTSAAVPVVQNSPPGDRFEVEVVQPDGRRALVVGKLDGVPEAAGSLALRAVVCDAVVRTLPAVG